MSWILILLCGLIVLASLPCGSGSLSKRFEYKHSFKGPHLVQKDRTVPFWTYIGNAIAGDDFVRLVPSLKSQRGLMWNKYPTEFDNWEVEVTFRVTGRGRIGADGLAFWYTMENEGLTGPVFGSRDQWNGLGVFFDSFDNDGSNNNPYVSAMLNDGTKKYDHQTDGLTQQIGGCMRDYRNKPYPVKARIRYENKVLMLFVHMGLTNQYADNNFELCMRAEGIEIPRGGHFSMSAATGALADDHDVVAFITHSLHTEEEMKAHTVQEEDKKKLDDEFQEYEKKLNESKTEYQKDHPVEEQTHKEEDIYQADDIRELRMIFEGQDNIHQQIQQINKRMNELVGMQERVAAQLSLLSSQGGAPQPPGQQLPQQPPIASIQKQDVDNLLRQSHDIINGVNSLRTVVDELIKHRKSAPDTPSYDGQKTQHELSDGINEIKINVKALVAQRAMQPPPPPCPVADCISTSYFGLFMVFQFVAVVIFSFIQSRRDSAAKKFY